MLASMERLGLALLEIRSSLPMDENMQRDIFPDAGIDEKSCLLLHLNVHQAIELDEFANTFKGMAYMYNDFLSERHKGGAAEQDSYQMYVKSVENNCILAQLVAPMLAGFNSVDVINTLVDFAGNLNNTFNYFSGLREQSSKGGLLPSYPYKKKDALAVAHLTSLAAKNENGSLGIKVIEYDSKNDGIKFNIEFDSENAQKIYNGAAFYLESLSERGTIDQRDVFMRFHQLNSGEFKAQGRTGDRAVVDQISSKDLPVYFSSPIDREKLGSIVSQQKVNPLQLTFLADIYIQTNVKGVPIAYRVINLKGLLDSGD